MELSNDTIVSAMAILIPASGQTSDDDTLITSEHVLLHAPSGEVLALVAQAFQRLGFQTDTSDGIVVSLTATVGTFEGIFLTTLVEGPHGGVMSVREGEEPASELPLEHMPAQIREAVQTVTFSDFPDFGPSGGFAGSV